ncbi:MAG: class I SAM-dependent methyltransferase [Cyanobacteriota bacterium]
MTHARAQQISTKKLIRLYRSAGIDVSKYFSGIDYLDLNEDASGLMSWQPAVVGDSDFYAQLASTIPFYYPHDKPEFSVALDQLPADSEVLEVGCGEGQFGSLLASDKRFGVDINEQAIQHATAKGLRCRVWNFLQDEVESLPKQEYPYICSFQMIEHLPDPGCFFAFAYRHLAPEGRLILGAPAMDSVLGKNPMSILNLPPHHQTWWTDRSLRTYPKQFGLVCEEIIHVPLDFAHHRAYMSTLLRDLLAKRISQLPPFLSNWINALSSKPIGLLTKLLVKEGSIDPIFGARGQSVVAIYRKTTPVVSTVPASHVEP